MREKRGEGRRDQGAQSWGGGVVARKRRANCDAKAGAYIHIEFCGAAIQEADAHAGWRLRLPEHLQAAVHGALADAANRGSGERKELVGAGGEVRGSGEVLFRGKGLRENSDGSERARAGGP
jgi:hypothetical protein